MLVSLIATLLAAQAPSSIEIVTSAIRQGEVGERYDGYLDFVGTPDEAMRRAVGAINIRRRALYSDLAARRRIAPREVGIATACKLFVRLPEGGAYMLADGEWRTVSSSAPVALPGYCPRPVAN